MALKTFLINSNQADYTDAELQALQTLFSDECIFDPDGNFTGFAVTENTPNNLSVNVAAGNALVEYLKNSVTWKPIINNSATVNLTIAANSTGSNRIDAVVIHIKQDEPNALKNNVAEVLAMTGTGVSALTDGAIDATLGDQNWYRLANITVANGASTILNANISDTRVRPILRYLQQIKTRQVSESVTGEGVEVDGWQHNDDYQDVTERAGDPPTPATGNWRFYFKADGFYIIDDTGAAVKLASFSSPTEQTMTAGENVTAGDALRVKNDGQVYKALRMPPVAKAVEVNSLPAQDGFGAVGIDTNKIAFCYGVGAQFAAVIKTLSDNTWGGGSGQTLDSGGATPWSGTCDIAKLDTDAFITVSYDKNEGDRPTLVACTVAGVVITAGTEVDVDASGTSSLDNPIRLAVIDTNKFVVVWADGGSTDQAKLRIGTVSGTTITLGTEQTISTDAQSGDCLDVAKLDTNKFGVCYQNTSNDLKVKAATVSGTVATLGAEQDMAGAITLDTQSQGPRIEQAGTDKFLIGYINSANDISYLVVGTVSGTTVTAGTPVVVNNDATNVAPTPLFREADSLWLFYAQEGVELVSNTYFNSFAKVSISGTVPTLHRIGQSTEFLNSDGFNSGLAAIDGDRCAMLTQEQTGFDIFAENVADNNYIGFADTTETSSNPVIVNVFRDDNQSSLSVGSIYYLDDVGAISPDGFVKAGVALTATRIYKI